MFSFKVFFIYIVLVIGSKLCCLSSSCWKAIFAFVAVVDAAAIARRVAVMFKNNDSIISFFVG